MSISIEQAARLFKIADSTCLYRDLRDELVAVSERRKGMSMHSVAADNEEESREFEAQAHQLSLRTERRLPTGPGPSIAIFAFHPEEAWRVAAYMAFAEAPFRWSDSAEFLHSILLGYTSEQATKWLDTFNDRKAGWHGETVFLTMSAKQKASTLDLYSRVLPYDHKMSVFYPLNWNLVIRRDATELVPPDTHIARVSVDALRYGIKFLSSGYIHDGGDLFFDTCSDAVVSTMNTYMTSEIQFLTDGQWLKYRRIRRPDNASDLGDVD